MHRHAAPAIPLAASDEGFQPIDFQDSRESGNNAIRTHALARTIVVAAVVLFIVSRLWTLNLPLERDEGEYAYVAQRLAKGDIPYADAFNQKTPGIFYVYRAAMALFGETQAGIHGGAAVFNALTAATIFLIGLRLLGELGASITLLAYVTLSIEPRLAATAANIEHFGNLPLTLAACLIIYSHSQLSTRRACLIGLCAGIAPWFKQVTLIPALYLLAASCVLPSGTATTGNAERKAGFRFGPHVLAITSFALVQAAGALFVASYLGVWDTFWNDTVLHNFEYGQRIGWNEGLAMLQSAIRHQFPAMLVFWSCIPIGFLALLQSRRTELAQSLGGLRPDTSQFLFVGGWLLSSAIAILPSFYFYHHYFIWLIPSIALLSGAGLSWIIKSRPTALARAVWGTGVCLLVISPTLLANRTVWLTSEPGPKLTAMYGQNLFGESIEIARYIRENSSGDERILIVGTEPQILFYAERRSVTRYIVAYPLFGRYSDTADRQQEVLTEMEQHPPDWILDVRLYTSRTPDVNRPRDLENQLSYLLKMTDEYEVAGLAIPLRDEQRYALEFGRNAKNLAQIAPRSLASGATLYRRSVTSE